MQLPIILLIDRLKLLPQLRDHPQGCLGLQIGQERGVYVRAVLVHDARADQQQTDLPGAVAAQVSHCAQRRRKQNERHIPFQIEGDDLRQDGKRRIIHYRAPVRVFFVLVVPARIERPHEHCAVSVVFVRHPVGQRVVDVLRRIAVVRRFRLFELLDERVILIISLFQCVAVELFALKPVRVLRLRHRLKAFRVKARELYHGRIEARQDGVQFVFVEASGDLVQRQVRLFLFFLAQPYHEDGNLRDAEVCQHLQPLMAAHQPPRALVPYQRIDHTQVLDARSQLLIVGISRPQRDARVVLRRLHCRHRHHPQLVSFHQILPP